MTKTLLFASLLALFNPLLGQAQSWFEANNPFGGRVLQIHETSEGSLLAGTTRGLYRSFNNGATWQNISGEFPNFPVLDVNSTPTGTLISLFSTLLRRSVDGGATWETLPAQDWTSLNIIVVNGVGQIFINTNNSVWRSSDNGDTWTRLTIDTNVPSLRALELSPDGELFAGTFNRKIYRSDDNGDNWTELFTAGNDIGTFAFDGNSTVYGATSFAGAYKSMDNGDNWSLLPALPGANGALDLNVNASGEVFAAAFDGGVLRSGDGGSTWEDITFDLIDPGVRKIFLSSVQDLYVGTLSAGVQMLSANTWTAKNEGIGAIQIDRFVSIDGVLYACTSAGVFISEDGGRSWRQSLRGMDDPEIAALAQAPNGDLYAGGEMLYISEDGVNWTKISQSFPDSEITATDILVEPGGRVIVATEDYGIRYTDNRGQSFSSANAGLEDITMNFIRRNAAGDLFTADGFNLYRSSDVSGAWQIINNGLSDTDITEFAVADGALFAITFSDGLFKSIDNGDNWSLAIDQDFNNVAVNGSDIYGASERIINGGVYFSDDNGESWNNIGSGLPNVQVESVNYVQGQGLFAGVRDFGLYTLNFSVNPVDQLFADSFEL